MAMATISEERDRVSINFRMARLLARDRAVETILTKSGWKASMR